MDRKMFNIYGADCWLEINLYHDNNVAVLLMCEEGEYGMLSVNVSGISGPMQFVLNHDCNKETYKEVLNEVGKQIAVTNYGFVTNQPVYRLNDQYAGVVRKLIENES